MVTTCNGSEDWQAQWQLLMVITTSSSVNADWIAAYAVANRSQRQVMTVTMASWQCDIGRDNW